MFELLKKYFNKTKKYIYSRVISVSYFFRFLFLVRYITKTDLTELSYNKLNKLKGRILSNGMVSLKFMQWYISKLENEDSKKYREVVKEFDSIFDNCPYHSVEQTKEIFKNDFGNDMENYLEILDEIGSGSIGQVYKAKMIDGKEVAFKVKHPEIETQKRGQFALINFIVFLQKFKFIKNRMNLHFDIEDFMDSLKLQLDFSNESFNCMKFSKNFKDNQLVIIPKLYYYSNNIVIQSYEKGDEFDNLSSNQKQKIVLNIYAFLCQMIMVDNFIHGDFHKKNWNVKLNNSSFPSLIVYDFGLCFETECIEYNRELWRTFENNKVENTWYFIKILIKGELKDSYELEVREHIDNLFERPFNINDLLEKLILFLKDRNLMINKCTLNVILLATLIEKLLLDANIIEKGIDYNNETARTDKVQSRRADILTLCRTTKTYPELEKYIKQEFESFNVTSLFNTDNSELIFDPI